MQNDYKEALNDIINSKKTDVVELKKIALKAIAKPVQEIADLYPLNWKQYEGEKFDWHLIVNEVFIACLCDEEMDGRKWILRDYDTDFAPIFGHGTMPDFDSLKEGKKYCEMKFLLWLKESSQLLLPSTPSGKQEEGLRQELDILNEMYSELQMEVGKWIEFKEGNPIPDYDEYVLWAYENGTCLWDALDKDGNPHIYGGEFQGHIYQRATHYRKIMNPIECDETFNIK